MDSGRRQCILKTLRVFVKRVCESGSPQASGWLRGLLAGVSSHLGRTKGNAQWQAWLRSAALVGLVLVHGCAATGPPGQWQGPAVPAARTVHTWSFDDQAGSIIETEHCRIYTTMTDEDFLDLLPTVLEGALAMYRRLIPAEPLGGRKMDFYVFQWRSQWDLFTQRHAGTDAGVYLRIRNGGYTVPACSVIHYVGREFTFALAAHEGWHQYAARHFRGRLPPFLEEGLACMFEGIGWERRLPKWNLLLNPQRARNLREAIDAGAIMPLEKLSAMHAGDVVGQQGQTIDGFYAQCWAFALFLWEAEHGRHRPGLQRWLSDTAAGTVYDPTWSHRSASQNWNPRAVRPMIEHYLGMPLASLEQEYLAFVKRLATGQAAVY